MSDHYTQEIVDDNDPDTVLVRLPYGGTWRQPRDFVCAICLRKKTHHYPGPVQSWPIPPVCAYCEHTWSQGKPTAGAFKDRRIAAVISALAEQIKAESYYQIHRHEWELS